MRLEAVAEVNEQAVGPREKRRLIEQDEFIDAAESIRSCLPACRLSLRFLEAARGCGIPRIIMAQN